VSTPLTAGLGLDYLVVNFFLLILIETWKAQKLKSSPLSNMKYHNEGRSSSWVPGSCAEQYLVFDPLLSISFLSSSSYSAFSPFLAFPPCYCLFLPFIYPLIFLIILRSRIFVQLSSFCIATRHCRRKAQRGRRRTKAGGVERQEDFCPPQHEKKKG